MTDKDEDLPLEFKLRLSAAKLLVSGARVAGSRLALANALKGLGDIERRLPQLRDDANRTYSEAAKLYLEIQMPLEAAWVLRHIGINQEYAERITEAEKYYDESLALFRTPATEDDGNYANTVRYPAVIKNRVGKREESTALWEEAIRRYEEMNQPLGVAEGAAWLAIFAHEEGDFTLARQWLEKAESSSKAAADIDTDKWVNEARTKIFGKAVREE